MLFKTKEKTIFTPSALNSQEGSSGHKHDRHMQPDPWPDKTSGKQNNNSPGHYKTKTYSEHCFQRPAFEQQYKQHPHTLSNLLLRDQFTVGKGTRPVSSQDLAGDHYFCRSTLLYLPIINRSKNSVASVGLFWRSVHARWFFSLALRHNSSPS